MYFEPDYPILTERLRLRPFNRGDVDAVYAYRRLAEVARYLFDRPMSREEVADTVQQRASQTYWQEEGDRLVLAAERLEDGLLIGEVSLIWRSEEHRQGEIGYIFNPSYHGRGFATEAAQRLLRIGFEEFQLHRIMARCNAENARSAAVMERIGMRREAHFREHMMVKSGWDEEFIYAILEDEWRSGLAQA